LCIGHQRASGRGHIRRVASRPRLQSLPDMMPGCAHQSEYFSLLAANMKSFRTIIVLLQYSNHWKYSYSYYTTILYKGQASIAFVLEDASDGVLEEHSLKARNQSIWANYLADRIHSKVASTRERLAHSVYFLDLLSFRKLSSFLESKPRRAISCRSRSSHRRNPFEIVRSS